MFLRLTLLPWSRAGAVLVLVGGCSSAPERQPSTVAATATAACDPVEVPYDGVDQDADPATADDDLDGDGLALVEDCDDADPAVGGETPEGVPLTWDGDLGSEDLPGFCAGACRRVVAGDAALAGLDDAGLESLACLVAVQGDLDVGIATWDDYMGRYDVDGNGVTSLAGLRSLSRVDGRLELVGNPLLTDLDGLQALRSVGGELSITDDAGLTSLHGLDGLGSVGGLTLARDPALTSLDGLGALQSGGSLSIEDDGALAGLDGLGRLAANSLRVVEDDALTSLSGLACLDVLASLTIVGDDALVSLDGLRSVTGITGDARISANPALATLDGLGALATIGGSLWLSSSCEGLQTEGGLVSLAGLDRLRSIGGDLQLCLTDTVTSLQGLEALERVDGSIDLFRDPALHDLPLRGLTAVGGWFSILYDASIRALPDLAALRTVGGPLELEDDQTLADVTGLYGLESVGFLEIIEDRSLGDDAAWALYDAIDSVGDVQIGGNDP